MKLKDIISKIKIYIPAIFIALKYKETPILAKIFGVVTVAYALSPIDLIPDFIPVLGYLDDVIILPVMIYITLKFIPKDIMQRSIDESQNIWKNGKPKKWYYGVPVILFWIIVLFFIIKFIMEIY